MQIHARESLIALSFACTLILLAQPATALSDPDDFCTGDPCLITASLTADPDITLDFGTRAVVLSNTLEIGDLPIGSPGSLTILAGSFSMIGNGQIKGNGGANQAGTVTIDVTGDMLIDGTRATGAFRMPGNDGGSVTLLAGGNITGSGKFNLDRDSAVGSGGELIVFASGLVNLSGDILAKGGVQGFGGTVDLQALGNLTLTGMVDITGGESGGGSLDIFSEGDISLGEIDMSAGGDAGDAGIGDILALGTLTFTDEVIGNGADNGENCGDAADLDISSDGDLAIQQKFTMRGRGLDCSGGFLTIDGDAVTITGELDLSATGTEGLGGDVDIASFSTLLISNSSDIRTDGPDGAGDVLIASDSDIFANGDIIASGNGPFGSGASLVEIDAATTLILSGSIDASGGASGSGGDVSIDGCLLTQNPASVIETTGASGVITVIGSDQVTLRGSFIGELTSPTPIEIRYGTLADPPDLASATFNVPPLTVLNPLLVPCSLCGSAAECDDANPCTDDACDPFTGCLYTANNDPCDDGNACTQGDQCFLSLCLNLGPVVCDDGNICTDDSCDPASGCQATANSAPCDDSDACTENDTCSAGACGGSPVDCEDGNPCTDDVCLAGACQSTNNTATCDDGDACTTVDECSGGACIGGAPPTCVDTDPCTNDGCDSGVGCVFDPIPGCFDGDGDGIIDDIDHCTTLDWSASPLSPPDQHPAKLRLTIKNLSKPAGEQGFILKGFFNVAAPEQPIQLDVDGVHFVLEDALGEFYEINIPGGAVGAPGSCDTRDGWAFASGSKPRWKYTNKSGALPPACTPGSAKGISTIQVKDLRSSGKAALQAKVKAKKGSVDRSPDVPLTKIQATLALSAEPAPGMASTSAINGQCAEALIEGNPISIKAPIPFCKQKFRDSVIDKVTCKGL